MTLFKSKHKTMVNSKVEINYRTLILRKYFKEINKFPL